MNPPTSRSDNRLNSVTSVAVTEFKEDVFTFRWNVRNFKERLNNNDPKKEKLLDSPLFTFEDENKNERQLVVDNPKCVQGAAQATKKSNPLPKFEWHLHLKWSYTEKRNILSTKKDTFLSLYLCLEKSEKTEAMNANWEIDLLDSEEKSWMNQVTGDLQLTSSEKRLGLLGHGWKKFLNIRDLLDPKNKLLEDNTLKIRCRIVMKRHVEHQLNNSSSTQKSPRTPDLSSMFTSSILTDVSIKTKGSILKAHKAVLSCCSPVFFTMFQTAMAESIQNVVEIADFEDDIVKWMLEYIYGVKISQEVLTENALELFQIADKYDIQGLKDFVEEILALNLSVETVVDTLILADMNAVSNLKAKAINFVNMNKEEVLKSDEFQKLLNYKHSSSILKQLFT